MARSELIAHGKFKRLCKKLSLPRPYALGLLEMMWQHGYQSGDDFLGEPFDVEATCEWPGEDGVLLKALEDGRWIDLRGSSYYIHDLWDHAPEYAKRRAERRGKHPRTTQKKELQSETDAVRQPLVDERTPDGGHSLPNGGRTAQVPNPTQPNPTQPKKISLAAAPPSPKTNVQPPSEKGSANGVASTFVNEFRDLIPAHFGKAFREEWAKWCAHKKERGQGITKATATTMFDDFDHWGESWATRVIRFSLGKGWNTLVQPTVQNGGLTPDEDPGLQLKFQEFTPAQIAEMLGEEDDDVAA